ncbi:pentapeptide repeat-containing protein [Ancylobacter lacus]|uniref:pentapeptide repeat-containing protein n=1 Tax=Ancylobacter lacus TaxID=2579970 RepID=UPI001BCF3261|nr:pentapeptide repeat-containing protein [Ancylobacter lacus]MBS7537890.1 pentapeptide repeat-containing protein [Ancylobacter lacus]
MLRHGEDTARRLDIHGAFVRRTDLSGTSLRGANMAGADATNAVFRHADFAGAHLRGTILRGADLTGAKNLTVEQLAEAVIDDSTILPSYIDRDQINAIHLREQK